jgi:hypothetical protein
MGKLELSMETRRSLEEVSVGDLLTALVTANEDALSKTLAELLAQSRNFAKALDETDVPIRRKELAARLRLTGGNFNRLEPLIAGGWLRVATSDEGLVFRRSPIVDRVLRGRSVAQWSKAREERSRG